MRELRAGAVLWPPDAVLDASATTEAVEDAGWRIFGSDSNQEAQPYVRWV